MAEGKDIFNTNPSFGGAFAMDEAMLTFAIGSGGDDGGLGQLVQGIQASYQREVTRKYELGPSKLTYYVLGRAEGSLAINRLAAPTAISDSFLTTFASVCNVPNNHLSINANPGVACTTATKVADAAGSNSSGTVISASTIKTKRYKFDFCLITSIAFQMNVESLALAENISIMFAKMSIEEGDGIKPLALQN